MTLVAEQFVEVLASVGIKRIYGIVGDSLNGLTDAIRRQGRIEWIHVRHEEVAAFAAGADAHVSGSLAVCAGSCGPGNLHLINGLFDCHRSQVPVLAIAAHIPSREIGSGYFQETHPQTLFAECSHYCELISSANQMPRTLEIAIREAVGKRGVSVVVIPGDVALQPTQEPFSGGYAGLLPPVPIVRPREADLRAMASILNGGKRVTLLCGAGCAGAHDDLTALAQRLKAPIVHTLRGKEHIEWDNPFDVGMTGLIGFSSGYFAMLDCDVLLMLGTDFPYRQFYPSRATKIIQVDLQPGNLGRRTHLDLGVVGDVGATINALLPLLDAQDNGAHLEKAVGHYLCARAQLDSQAAEEDRDNLIHPQLIARTLSELAAPDAIFTCDVGLPTVWAARYLAMNGQRRLMGSFWHGSMANAMAQAIGAQAAFPGRQVISLSGDGGFSMLMGDFLSLVQLGLPVKVIVFNNGALGFIELEQKSTGFLNTGTSLNNPDFAAMARAAGVNAIRIEKPEQVVPAIESALAHDGPCLIDALVNRHELAMPPALSIEMVGGFTMYMIKAVLNHRGNEIIDLAKSNLWL